MIDKIFKNLTSEKKEELLYAFEHGLTCTIEYEKGKFIGVNINVELDSLQLQEESGDWSIGLLR